MESRKGSRELIRHVRFWKSTGRSIAFSSEIMDFLRERIFLQDRAVWLTARAVHSFLDGLSRVAL